MKKNSIYITLILLMFLSVSCSIKSKKGLIVSKLEKASKLSTVEVVVSKNVFKRDERFLLKDRYFLARTEATIKFGIDFSKIKNNDVLIRGDEIYMKLPPIEITNFSYPAEKFFIDTIITDMDRHRIPIEEIDGLYRQSELQIRQTIELLNMKKTAEDKTRQMVRLMCHNMGFDVIEIEFDSTRTNLFNL